MKFLPDFKKKILVYLLLLFVNTILLIFSESPHVFFWFTNTFLIALLYINAERSIRDKVVSLVLIGSFAVSVFARLFNLSQFYDFTNYYIFTSILLTVVGYVQNKENEI